MHALTSYRMSGEMPDTVEVKDNQLKVLKVDERVNTTFVCEVKSRLGAGKDQISVLVRGEWSATNAGHHKHSKHFTGAISNISSSFDTVRIWQYYISKLEKALDTTMAEHISITRTSRMC